MSDETINERFNRLEALIQSLLERELVKEFYTPEEFARLVGRAEFTCREWCRLGRVHARKKLSGRGKSFSWAIPHEELLRFRRDGLLPDHHLN